MKYYLLQKTAYFLSLSGVVLQIYQEIKMKKLVFALIFCLSFSAYADDFENIAQINTNDDGLIGAIEKSAANFFYMGHPDIYDFLFIYTTFTPTINMQQGIPIQYTVQGIAREGITGYGKPADWGSAGKLLGAARMVNIDMYPDDPDAAISTGALSPYQGMSTIELQAHEWSHYWLATMDFRKEGMTENHTGLRGWEDGANNHWNADFMSGPSVMYGGDIVDNEDGTFTYTFSNPKKYGQLDLYTMGLIPPEEVGEMFFTCSSENIEECREGSASVPIAKTAEPKTKSGLYKHVVTIDDVIRAMGERVPACEDSPKHFNIAFIIVSKFGVTPFPQQLQKLENIRVRFQEWFTWATGGRATVCTELDGDCENSTEQPDEDTETADEDTAVETPDETVDESVPDETETVDEEETPDVTETTDEEEITDNTEENDESTSENPDNPFIDDEVGCGCTLVF